MEVFFVLILQILSKLTKKFSIYKAKPIFQRYNVDLREDSPLGADIIVVHATDGDAGVRGRIRYLIRDNSVRPDLNDRDAVPITSRRYPVTVNAMTGAVVLRDKLNHKLHDG